MEKQRDHLTCYSCGLRHELVEAGGVWHCPNPMCMMCGASWFKRSLKSYTEYKQHYAIDEDEWLTAGHKVVKNMHR